VNHDALHPVTEQAGHVATLFWWMLGVAAVVYLTVLAAFFLAPRASRKLGIPAPDGTIAVSEDTTRRLTFGVSLAVGATVLILLVFLVYDFAIGRTLATKPSTMLTIEITGRQWWWQITYKDPDPSKQVVTANEIHVPVGIPVQLQLESRDVIHSFWVPNLRGKKDLVPGYTTSTWFRVDTPGVYRGQCAEFCGHQHAKMAMYVVAEPADQFNKWLESQRAAAQQPMDSTALEGQKVFLAGPCSNCHTIAGTSAHGMVGPDLTHLASRTTIAAGTLPRTRGHLAGWIVDPQSIKPGAQMPSNQLEPKDLQALLVYLETLK
jgi:cytochrome c oxidase subunit II